MRHTVGHARIPLVGVHRFAGQALHRCWRDEMASRLRHDDLHPDVSFDQQTQQFCRLVGSNTACDAQDHVFFRQDAFCLFLFHNAAHINKKPPVWA